MSGLKVAIMQPYFFPYFGYFQLINEVDTFVFYDDVNYIKKGWINRNRILIDGKDKLTTISCKKVSQNKLIKDIEIDYSADYQKLLSRIRIAYKKAPYFNEVITVLENTLNTKYKSISELNISSIKAVFTYLEKPQKFCISSQNFGSSKGMSKADRLINITKSIGAGNYVNPIGGVDLYDKNYFLKQDVKLWFMQHHLFEYKQFETAFVSGLSIIDVLMFNDKETIIANLSNNILI